MQTVLQMDKDGEELKRLARFWTYRSLSESDTDLLILLCLALKPDILMNKCIFLDDEMCGYMDNEFYEIEAVKNSLLVAGSVMIRGRSRRVSKIMTFKMPWLKEHWMNPMKELIEEQERKRAQAASKRQQERDSGCTIL
ncbi:uncharacterized protein LOC127871642 [Dreissena polymorpha]|nr:uncharacterized protein LOC127871642 [Dreissena polymorpha]